MHRPNQFMSRCRRTLNGPQAAKTHSCTARRQESGQLRVVFSSRLLETAPPGGGRLIVSQGSGDKRAASMSPWSEELRPPAVVNVMARPSAPRAPRNLRATRSLACASIAFCRADAVE
jgi:hypothetical protein